MKTSTPKDIGAAVVLILLQVWVLNQIYLFRLGTPFLYLFALMLLPMDTSKAKSTLWGAAIGFAIDFLSGTGGLHMAATALAGFLRPFLLNPMIDMEVNQIHSPSSRVLGGRLFLVLFVWTLVHHISLFFLDALLHFQWLYLVKRMGVSLLVSYVGLALMQLLFLDKTPNKEE